MEHHQIHDRTAREKLGLAPGERLSNQLAILEKHADNPFDVKLVGTLLTIEAATKQDYETNKEQGMQTAFKKAVPRLGGIEMDPGESTLDIADGATTGDFENDPASSVAVPASEYILMGIELRPVLPKGKWYAVWGVTNANPLLVGYPAFTDESYHRLVWLLRNNSTPGVWEFVAPVKTDIRLLPMGGTGGGGTGDANELLERLKNQLENSIFERATANIISSDKETKIDVLTGEFNVIDKTVDLEHVLGAPEYLQSIEHMDDQFKTALSILERCELSLFYKEGSVDAQPLTEVSRNQGNTWQRMIAERHQDTDTVYGEHTFGTDFAETGATIREHLDLDITEQLTTTLSLAYRFTLAGALAFTKCSMFLGRVGSPAGHYRFKVVGEDTGLPDKTDVLWTGRWKSVNEVNSGGLWLEEIADGLEAGTYWFLVETTQAYKDSADGSNRLYTYLDDDANGDSAEEDPLDTWTLFGTGELISRVIEVEEYREVVAEHPLSEATGALRFDDGITTGQIAQQIPTIANPRVVSQVRIHLNKTGTPAGVIFARLLKKTATDPDTSETVWASPAILVADLAAGANELVYSAHLVVEGDYFLHFSTDQDYKDSWVNGVDEVLIPTDGAAAPSPSIIGWNGATWSSFVGAHGIYNLLGYEQGLRVRVYAGTTGTHQVAGYGIFYDVGTVSVLEKPSHFHAVRFHGTNDNLNEFELPFLIEPKWMSVFVIETAQVIRYGAWSAQGRTCVFPVNTFYGMDNVTLWFVQATEEEVRRVIDNSDFNRALLAANHLGSMDADVDMSVAGRGRLQRRPDGTMIEITVNDANEVEIYELTP